MRNLTLGVLIVTGGTLAALPFRRGPAIPDASVEPTHATGPTESVLNPSTAPSYVLHQGSASLPLRNRLPQTKAADDQAVFVTSPFSATGYAPMQTYANAQAFPQPGPAHPGQSPQRSSNRIERPLTFEDLMEPIERPEAVRQRLGAVAEIRQEDLQHQRALDIAAVSPSVDPVAPAEETRVTTPIRIPVADADQRTVAPRRAGVKMQARTPRPPQADSSPGVLASVIQAPENHVGENQVNGSFLAGNLVTETLPRPTAAANASSAQLPARQNQWPDRRNQWIVQP